MDKDRYSRLKYIYYFFIISFFILSSRIIYLQVFRNTFFKNLSKNQYFYVIPIEGKRGKIFDTKNRLLATSIGSYSLFADPSRIENPNLVASVLSSNLDIPKDEILNKLNKNKRFVWIKRKLSLDEKEKISHLKLKGIGFVREYKRVYIQKNLARSLLGAVDIDNKGISGLEIYYDNYLRGKNGYASVLRDSLSREIFINPNIISPKEGSNIILTIDAQIQFWTEKYLADTIEKFSAQHGSVVVMRADTGEILALANYSKDNSNRNFAICDSFEPGSVFKIVTLLASIESGKFSDDYKVFCENGEYKIQGTTLHDWKPYGLLSFKEVFKKSSNIGVAKIANILGKSAIYNYIKKFGFGEKTGIDFFGEVPGKIKPPHMWSKTSNYIIPIGQEVSVNLMQLVVAFASVVNGGYLTKPYLLKNIDSDFLSKEIKFEKKKIFSDNTVERAKKILIEVVEDGTGALAKVNGLTIGGKTGTAQVYDPSTGKYSFKDYRASFIGFIDNLEFPIVIGVSIFGPKKSHFGGVVAAPLFKKIAEKIALYFGFKNEIKRNI